MYVYNSTHLRWQQIQCDDGQPAAAPLDDAWLVQKHHGPFSTQIPSAAAATKAGRASPSVEPSDADEQVNMDMDTSSGSGDIALTSDADSVPIDTNSGHSSTDAVGEGDASSNFVSAAAKVAGIAVFGALATVIAAWVKHKSSHLRRLGWRPLGSVSSARSHGGEGEERTEAAALSGGGGWDEEAV